MITGTRYQLQLEVGRQLSLQERIARLEIEVSTQKKIQAPSDDPVASVRIAGLQRGTADRTQWKTNLEQANALSESADDVMTATTTALTRAAELVNRANNTAVSNEDRIAIAIELSSIAEEIISLRDTKDARGLPLFATGVPTAIPVGANLSLTPVNTQAAVFGNVATTAGPQDIVAIISNAANRVRTSDFAGMTTSIDETNQAVGHIASQQGEQGSRGARIDALLEANISTQLNATDERKGLQDTDVTEALAKIASLKTTLDASQAIYVQTSRASLFDLLT